MRYEGILLTSDTDGEVATTKSGTAEDRWIDQGKETLDLFRIETASISLKRRRRFTPA